MYSIFTGKELKKHKISLSKLQINSILLRQKCKTSRFKSGTAFKFPYKFGMQCQMKKSRVIRYFSIYRLRNRYHETEG